MISLDIAMYTFFKNLMLVCYTSTSTSSSTFEPEPSPNPNPNPNPHQVFYTFDAARRWWRGGSIRRRWRLRRRLHGVVSWSV